MGSPVPGGGAGGDGRSLEPSAVVADQVVPGGELGLASSTVHAVLVRCRINRLRHIDRVAGEPIRGQERDYTGSLIHVDVTKLGNIPDGGGWRS